MTIDINFAQRMRIACFVRREMEINQNIAQNNELILADHMRQASAWDQVALPNGRPKIEPLGLPCPVLPPELLPTPIEKLQPFEPSFVTHPPEHHPNLQSRSLVDPLEILPRIKEPWEL